MSLFDSDEVRSFCLFGVNNRIERYQNKLSFKNKTSQFKKMWLVTAFNPIMFYFSSMNNTSVHEEIYIFKTDYYDERANLLVTS